MKRLPTTDSDKEQIAVAYSTYCQTVINKENKKTVDFLYPKLFDYIPKSHLIDALKNAQKDKSQEIQLGSFEITSIGKTTIIDSIRYAVFSSSCTLMVIFKPMVKPVEEENDEPADGDVSQAEFTFEIFKKKYGKKNVSYNKKMNTIAAKPSNRILAIHDPAYGNRWTFLEVRESMLDLFIKFVPKEVFNSLK
jgi:hypothetical protein